MFHIMFHPLDIFHKSVWDGAKGLDRGGPLNLEEVIRPAFFLSLSCRAHRISSLPVKPVGNFQYVYMHVVVELSSANQSSWTSRLV